MRDRTVGSIGRYAPMSLVFGGLCTARSLVCSLHGIVQPFIALAAPAEWRQHWRSVSASWRFVADHPCFPQVSRRQAALSAVIATAYAAVVHGGSIRIALWTYGAAHLEPPNKSAHPTVLYLLHWRFHRLFSDHRWMALFRSPKIISGGSLACVLGSSAVGQIRPHHAPV